MTFEPFKPATPKKGNAVTEVTDTVAAEPTEPAKKPRKKRGANKPRAVKLELASAVAALGGLKEDDIEALGKMIELLQPLTPKARMRIVAALAKVFE